MPRRSELFEPNPRQAELLAELSVLLACAEEGAGQASAAPRLPVVFIIGPPRSGTTLALQWLASTGVIAYPTNLLSRFFAAPYVGARIQQLLTDAEFDFAGELTGAGVAGHPFRSRAGKTVGLLEPHEFSFFWRRFYPVGQARPLTERELAASDAHGFAGGLAQLERAFGKPFAMKGILLQYNLKHLAELLPTALFLRTERDAFQNVRSLLDARRAVTGGINEWFSVEPPGSAWLRRQDPYEQAAGQVAFTNHALDSQLAGLPAGRIVRIDYDRFCRDAHAAWSELSERLRGLGVSAPEETPAPARFDAASSTPLAGSEDARIREAIATVARARETALAEEPVERP